jgi:anhydro-N-acetylmuramic acid kinase
MSGTSLDGVDGVLTDFKNIHHAAYIPFPESLQEVLMRLQTPSENELHYEALAANQIAHLYAACVHALLDKAQLDKKQITAIGAHGQTIRHRPELGYTRQINNPALLAELTGIDVVTDFRSRDIAAGGQGAPLVPAFHQAVFSSKDKTRVIANIGGISNITILRADGTVLGFDTGPGNMLMDAWMKEHQGLAFDAEGKWAASGSVDATLLARFMDEDFLQLAPPKSTGRDLFNRAWLASKLPQHDFKAVDVQATLTAFTAQSLCDAIKRYAPDAEEIVVCGGGARNTHLMGLIHQLSGLTVTDTGSLGMPISEVEATAFAWLAKQFCLRLPGNLPAVTGAQGLRILGAHYPA